MSEAESNVHKKCHFYKLLRPSIIQQKKLRLPTKFVKIFRHQVEGVAVAVLSITDVCEWPVSLTQTDGSFSFDNGWHEFLERNSIRTGQLFYFEFEGNATFNVKVYDLVPYKIERLNIESDNRVHQKTLIQSDNSPCSQFCCSGSITKDYVSQLDKVNLLPSSCIGKSQPASTSEFTLPDKAKNTKLDTDNEILHSLKTTDKSQMSIHSTVPTKFQFNSIERGSSASADYMREHCFREAVHNLELTKKQKYDFNGKNLPAPPNKEVRMQEGSYVSVSWRKRFIPDAERERAINAAIAFQSINPFCRVVLRPSYLHRKGCFMHLPSKFYIENLTVVLDTIKLEISDGRQWTVQCVYNGTSAKLCGSGWYDFSQDKNLEEGDVCIFELIKLKDVVMKVTIFRPLTDSQL